MLKVAYLLNCLDSMAIELTFEKLCQPTGVLCDSSTPIILTSCAFIKLSGCNGNTADF